MIFFPLAEDKWLKINVKIMELEQEHEILSFLSFIELKNLKQNEAQTACTCVTYFERVDFIKLTFFVFCFLFFFLSFHISDIRLILQLST